MNATVLTSIAVTGFTIAFLHAAIPTHWLPFALVARARGWGRAKTLAVTLAAGLGHVAVTTALGLAIAWFGYELDERLGRFFPWIIGLAMIAVGLFFLYRQWHGGGLRHHHVPGGHHRASEACAEEKSEHLHMEHEIEESELVSDRRSDWGVIGGLFLMLTLSPCEGFLPVYASGVRFGWHGFIVLSLILAVGALAAMTLFTWLALTGLERANVKALERWESGLLGGLFCVLGVLVVLLER